MHGARSVAPSFGVPHGTCFVLQAFPDQEFTIFDHRPARGGLRLTSRFTTSSARSPRNGLRHGRQAKADYRGHLLIEIVLWCCFLLPGLIYTIWRHCSGYKGCRACGRTASCRKTLRWHSECCES